MEQKNEIAPKAVEDDHIKMDWSLETAPERIEKLNEIIANTPSNKLTPQYLEKMADYLINTTTLKERKQDYNIITINKTSRINKREFSFEGLAEKLENGEDGIYNMIANDKNILVTPRKGFTKDDIENIPGLKDLMESIKQVQVEAKNATGMKRYKLNQQVMEMQSDQYELKKMFIKPVHFINIKKSMPKLDLGEKVYLDSDGVTVKSTGLLNLFDPKHISLLLCSYSVIKEDCWDKYHSDIKWLMEDLDNLIEKTLKDNYPLYYSLLIYKIDGKQNTEIQKLLAEEHGITHTVEYISSLWRNKIPKLLAEAAAEDWLVWNYTFKEKGKWKRCSRCGQIKLANNRFFSKNKTSKDGWYSICKCCRNKKK